MSEFDSLFANVRSFVEACEKEEVIKAEEERLYKRFKQDRPDSEVSFQEFKEVLRIREYFIRSFEEAFGREPERGKRVLMIHFFVTEYYQYQNKLSTEVEQLIKEVMR